MFIAPKIAFKLLVTSLFIMPINNTGNEVEEPTHLKNDILFLIRGQEKYQAKLYIVENAIICLCNYFATGNHILETIIVSLYCSMTIDL